MDGKNNSKQNCTQYLAQLSNSTLTQIVSVGFEPEVLRKYQEETGQEPTATYVHNPVNLLADLGTLGIPVNPELYRMFGERLDIKVGTQLPGFREHCLDCDGEINPQGVMDEWHKLLESSLSVVTDPKSAPDWLSYLTTRQEESLTDCLQGMFSELDSGKQVHQYTPEIKVRLLKPREYHQYRLEQKNTNEQGSRKGTYVSSVELEGLTFDECSSLITTLSELLTPEGKIGIHNNEQGVHKQVSQLSCALDYLNQNTNYDGSTKAIVKIDSSQVNLYMKKNGSYHLQFDIKGTKEIIAEYNGIFETKIHQFYLGKRTEAMREIDS